MTGQNQTPAPRRFLPPSSTSRLQHNRSSSQRTSFARPSQLTSSSPFSRAPFSNNALRDDDIQTSFEEEEDLPQNVASTASSKALRDSRDRTGAGYHASHKDVSLGSSAAMTPYGRREDRERSSDNAGSSSPRADFSSPLPKRQKISHSKNVSAQPIQVSSSPSESNDDFMEPEGLGATAAQRSDDSGLNVMGPDTGEDLDEEHSARTRFRIRPTSESATTQENKRPSTRGAFKGIHGTGTHWLETPLPATFSPSKRKGKYEYVYGGAAETVRNWILEVASEQSRATQGVSQTLRVDTGFSDTSGRFDIVNDEEGRNWMLVHQDTQKERLRDLSDKDQEKGKSVSIKGRSTSWSVEMPGASSSKEAQPDLLHVAVLWEPGRQHRDNAWR